MLIWTSWDNSALPLNSQARKLAQNSIKGVTVCSWGMPLEILLMLDAKILSLVIAVAYRRAD